jgi:hypothetical protein
MPLRLKLTHWVQTGRVAFMQVNEVAVCGVTLRCGENERGRICLTVSPVPPEN